MSDLNKVRDIILVLSLRVHVHELGIKVPAAAGFMGSHTTTQTYILHHFLHPAT
jgi:hypothetical protein